MAAGFARIINRLAALWPEPSQCLQYLDELCFDRRGGRQGFPLEVAAELLALKNHLEPHTPPVTAWAFEREEKYDPALLVSIEADLEALLRKPSLPQGALPNLLEDSELFLP